MGYVNEWRGKRSKGGGGEGDAGGGSHLYRHRCLLVAQPRLHRLPACACLGRLLVPVLLDHASRLSPPLCTLQAHGHVPLDECLPHRHLLPLLRLPLLLTPPMRRERLVLSLDDRPCGAGGGTVSLHHHGIG